MEEQTSQKFIKRRLSRRMVLAGAAVVGAGLAAAKSTENAVRAASGPIIDMHNHIVAPGAIDVVKRDPEKYGMRVNPVNASGVGTIAFLDGLGGTFTYEGGAMVSGYPPVTITSKIAYSDLNNSKAHLKAIGADGAALSHFTGWHRYLLPTATQVTLTRTLNDELAKWITGESMFKGTATLPIPDGEAAAAELRRATRDLKFKGAMIGTNLETATGNLDDPRLEPLWKAADELEAPIFLHPTSPMVGNERLNGWGLSFLGNAFDTTVAFAYLWASGILDRYPKMKIILSHGGGYVSVAYGRMSHYYVVAPSTTGKVAKAEASKYLNRVYYDTILHRPESLTYLIKVAGADHVMFGTDYPFTNEPPDPIGQVRRLPISQDDKDAVLGSAAKVYGFS